MALQQLISRKRIATASLVNIFYLAVSSISFLVLTPLALTTLGAELYGLWVILLAFHQIILFLTFGSPAVTIKYISQFSVAETGRDGISAVITFEYSFVALIGVLLTLLTWVLRYFLAGFIKTEMIVLANTPDAVGLMAAGILPLMLYQVSRSILVGLVRNELVGGIDTLQGISLLAGALVVGLLHGSLYELVFSTVIVYSLFFLIATFLALRATAKIRPFFTLNPALIKEMLNYGFLSWIASLGVTLFQSCDRILVGIIISPSAAGVYGIATSVALRLSLVSVQLSQVLVPYASSHKAKGLDVEIYKTYTHISRVITFITIGLGITLATWIGLILRLWISADFAQNYGGLFSFIIIAYSVFSIAAPAHHVLSGLGQALIPAFYFMGVGLLMLVSLAFLASRYGLWGAGAANYLIIPVIGMIYHLARQFSSAPLRDLLVNVGLPLLLFASAAVICSLDVPFVVRLVNNCIVLIICAGVMLVNLRQFQLFSRLAKAQRA